jgi:hypothetical protein
MKIKKKQKEVSVYVIFSFLRQLYHPPPLTPLSVTLTESNIKMQSALFTSDSCACSLCVRLLLYANALDAAVCVVM